MNTQNNLPTPFTLLQTDLKGFVLGTIVTLGNVHDSHMLQPLVEKIMEKVQKPLAVAADASYKTPAITNFLLENEITPALPYTRPKTKEGFMRKHMSTLMMNTMMATSVRQERF